MSYNCLVIDICFAHPLPALHSRDRLNLDINIVGETGSLNAGPRGFGAGEHLERIRDEREHGRIVLRTLLVDLVHRSKVVHVFQVYVNLNDFLP